MTQEEQWFIDADKFINKLKQLMKEQNYDQNNPTNTTISATFQQTSQNNKTFIRPTVEGSSNLHSN